MDAIIKFYVNKPIKPTLDVSFFTNFNTQLLNDSQNIVKTYKLIQSVASMIKALKKVNDEQSRISIL